MCALKPQRKPTIYLIHLSWTPHWLIEETEIRQTIQYSTINNENESTFPLLWAIYMANSYDVKHYQRCIRNPIYYEHKIIVWISVASNYSIKYIVLLHGFWWWVLESQTKNTKWLKCEYNSIQLTHNCDCLYGEGGGAVFFVQATSQFYAGQWAETAVLHEDVFILWLNRVTPPDITFYTKCLDGSGTSEQAYP
jgi:hypothetical protein